MTYQFVKLQGNFDIRKNFWEHNFQLSLIEPFKFLYDRDTSKDKEVSSRELWCIWLELDNNYENKISRLPIDQRRSAILAYNPNFDFNDPLIAACLLAYPEHCLTPAAKSFKSEEDTLRKFAELIEKKIEEEEITLDSYISLGNNRFQLIKGTANQLADLKKKNAALYPQYDKIRRMFEEEQNELRLFGGGKETQLEKGQLMLIEDDED